MAWSETAAVKLDDMCLKKKSDLARNLEYLILHVVS